MNPFSLFGILFCAWALCNFWFIPLINARWKNSDLRQKVARAGVVAVLEKIRDVAVAGEVALILIVLLVLASGWLAASHLDLPKVIITAMSTFYSIVKSWAAGYGSVIGTVTFLGAIACLWLVARTARERVLNAFRAKVQEVMSGFFEDGGALDIARADPELAPLMARLAAASQALEAESASQVPERIAQAKALFTITAQQLSVEVAVKTIDIGASLGHPTPTEQTQPKTRLQRFGSVLASERLAKDLGLIQKPLSYVVTGLLMFTLVGWTAQPMADSLRLAINNVRVNVLNSSATKHLDELISRDIPPEKSSTSVTSPAELQRSTQLVARAVTDDFLHSDIIERSSGVAHTNEDQAEFVRGAILGERLPDTDTDTTGGAPALTQDVAKGFDSVDGISDPGEITRIQRGVEIDVRPMVEALGKKNPGILRQLVEHIEARYTSTPIAPLDAQGKILGRAVGQLLGLVEPDGGSEASKQAMGLVNEFGEQATKTWVNAEIKERVIDLFRSELPRSMPSHPATFRFLETEKLSSLSEEIHSVDPSRRLPSPAEEQEAQMTKNVADTVQISDTKAFAERDFSPESIARARKILKERGESNEQVSDEIASAKDVHANATVEAEEAVDELRGYDHLFSPESLGNGFRAITFEGASMSFRARGVIVGRDLKGSRVDIRGLRWEIQSKSNDSTSTRVMLEVNQDGRWKALGSFDASVVNQGLRYAADRRAVATTIVQGDGQVIERSTSLHPALIDTPLGCRIVESDRFIDTFTLKSPVNPALAEMKSDRTQMWEWLQLVSAAEKIGSRPQAESECMANINSNELQKLGNTPYITFSPPTARSLRGFIQSRERADDNWKFLDNMYSCATGAGNKLSTCVCSSVTPNGIGPMYWFPEDHTSQVREKEAVLDPSLHWLQRSSDFLGNIEFVVHTTFSLRKVSDHPKPGDEATAVAFDFPPEQIAALRSVLASQLHGFIERDCGGLGAPCATTYKDFMGPIEDFILVQRFVRAALAGELGENFPLSRLIALERATRIFVPTQPTGRWDPANLDNSAFSNALDGGESYSAVTLGKTDFVNALRNADPKAAETQVKWEMSELDRHRRRLPLCDPISR